MQNDIEEKIESKRKRGRNSKVIIVGLSSVSWFRDHIGEALIDNGIGPSPQKQGVKRAKVKREEWCSLAGPVIR